MFVASFLREDALRFYLNLLSFRKQQIVENTRTMYCYGIYLSRYLLG